LALLGATANSPAHEVISSHIVTSFWGLSYAGASGSISLMDATVGDDGFVMGSEASATWEYFVGGDQYRTYLHEFGAYVRVKWTAKAPPDPTTMYTAKYRVWGLRYLRSGIGWNQGVQNRWAINSSTVSGNYVPIPNQLTFYRAFPDEDPMLEIGSDPDIFDNPYPVYGGNQYGWEYQGELATLAYFEEEEDGWYADFPVTNAILHDGHFEVGGPIGPTDSIYTTHQGRVYYQLWWAVDGPVN
jgi:hypothetical protein